MGRAVHLSLDSRYVIVSEPIKRDLYDEECNRGTPPLTKTSTKCTGFASIRIILKPYSRRNITKIFTGRPSTHITTLKAQRKKESSNVIEDAYQCGVNALSSSDKIESNEGNKEDGEKSLYALYAKQNAETLHLSIQSQTEVIRARRKTAWDKLAQIKKLEQEVKDIKRSTDPINKDVRWKIFYFAQKRSLEFAQKLYDKLPRELRNLIYAYLIDSVLRDSPRSSSRNPDFDRFYDILRAQLQTHLTHPDWFGLCVTEFADAYYWNEEFETRLEKIDVLFQDMYDEYAFYLIPVDHIRSLTVKIETSSTLSEKEIASTTDNLEKLLKCKDPKKIELGFVFIYHNEVEAVAENVPHGVWANLKAFGPSVYKLKAAGFRIRMATVEYLFEKNNEKNSRDILDWFVLNEEEWIGKVDKEINERGKEDDDVLQGTRS